MIKILQKALKENGRTGKKMIGKPVLRVGYILYGGFKGTNCFMIMVFPRSI